jgi:transposase
MAKNTRFVGLDVHAETIAVAVAEGRGKVQALGTIPNRAEAVRRLLGKVGKRGELRVCYEAGPTGYAPYWQLTAMGIACEVIAPSLAPSKPGDRVKTDRRDAERLASSYQAGTLTGEREAFQVATRCGRLLQRFVGRLARMSEMTYTQACLPRTSRWFG